ncbi:MAG: alpha-L-rhamnosidase [Puniceicoccaceae bacterium 5H]|nr:MAG: alpha-L-rhamnosidase [Puniceicoccaceae bacterium 5H]
MIHRLLRPLFVTSALLTLATTHAAPPGPPQGLLCELLRYPERAVITDAQPEFGWIVNDPQRGAIQSACQILVASSPAKLAEDTGDVWDSGKVATAQSINRTYGGEPLTPQTRYWWKVRTWNATGEVSAYSKPQAFETGTFAGADDAFPGQSQWVQNRAGSWVLEDRQRADYRDIEPVVFTQTQDRRTFADFGRAAFGTLRVTVEAPEPGEALVIYLGERKTEDQAVDKHPGASNIGYQRLELPLQEGRHTYLVELPRHVSHYPNSQVLPAHLPEVMPFRYVEIEASPQTRVTGLTQVALFHPFDADSAHFASSDTDLDAVWQLCAYTLEATPFLSLYLDGNRERMPYEADSYIQQLGHYSVDREYAVARYTLDFLLYNPSWPTEWQMHTVMMAWADYRYTGDTEFIEAHYAELRAKTLLALAREDGLISTRTGRVTDDFLRSIHAEGTDIRDIVDWPPGTGGKAASGSHQGTTVQGERDGYVFEDINTVVNAFHYHALRQMADLAEAVDRDEDAAFLRERAAQVKAAFNRLLLDPERGVYVDGLGTEHASLHANMFPLAFGLVPEKYVPSVAAHLKRRGMACSVYGAQYLLEALYNAGESAYALDLMTSDSRRSWLNMLRVGSTMTTEAWDEIYKPNLTWNHAWGSAPANILPRRTMGIQPLEPAFRRVRIQPQPDGLASLDLQTPTIRGPIRTRWQAKDGRYTLEVSIPANTTAEVWLPGDTVEDLTEGNTTLDAAEAVRIVGPANGYQIVEIPGGTYVFRGPRE